MLDDHGLEATIEWQAAEFERRSGISCRVVKADSTQLRSTECALALYRVFQEALDNVVRHSGATEVEVGTELRNGYVTLRVSDNGRGIADEEMASPSALGLAAMRERVLACGGKLAVRRGDEGGTIVEASAPAALPANDADAA
jgi:two-component system sensor histidine kinase UhpB